MVLGTAFCLGQREESILTTYFVLTWTTMMLGFTNELYSRPKSLVDDTEYTIGIRENDVTEENLLKDPYALKLIASEAWEGDRAQRDAAGNKLQYRQDNPVAQRKSNYLRRMWPHFLGWFPFLTVWVLIVKFLFTSILDTRELRGYPDASMPDWVFLTILGTFLLYTSFAPVQALYTYLPPAHYWGSEVCYLLLSLTAKSYLGMFLLLNVILADTLEEVAPELTTG